MKKTCPYRFEDEYNNEFSKRLVTTHKEECFFSPLGRKSTLGFKLDKKLLFEEWEKFYLDNLSSYGEDLAAPPALPIINSELLDLVVKII